MDKITFVVKENHLKLLRRAYVSWDDCEYGAPAIDCKRPYGNSDVVNDMMEILGIDNKKRFPDDEPFYTDEEIEYVENLHAETKVVLQIVLATGMFKAGTYESDKYTDNWKKID